MRRLSPLLGLLLLLRALPATALDMQRLEASHSGSDYALLAQAHLDASPERVYALSAQPQLLPKLSATIQSVTVLASPLGPEVRSYSRLCIASYCQQMQNHQQLRLVPSLRGGEVLAQIIPGEAISFVHGHSRINVEPEGQGSRVTITSLTQPKLWLPPLLGPWAVMRQMKLEAQASLARLEALARE